MTELQIDPRPYSPDVERSLKAMDERAVREAVLPELLKALDFFDVRQRHGAREEGKDLLAWRNSVLGTHDWHGFVVKVGDLNAQVTSAHGVRSVLHQVEQVLDHEITDPLTSGQTFVRECWVVTTGTIPGPALDEVAVTLRRHHLHQAVRWIDGKKLSSLLCEHLPAPQLDAILALPAKTEEVLP
ncbi:MAG: hypothetical protein RDU25_00220 [Patescibacteria group bacterium]|nr:hypothetical protein [Patescibacteria group bacterium]